MSFYKLEGASIEEAKTIINKLDEEERRDYVLKAAAASYISNEIFSLLIKSLKEPSLTVTQAFGQVITQPTQDGQVNPKLQPLLDSGVDFSHIASQSLINYAYKMNPQTVELLIKHGGDPTYADNSALRNALSENNTPVINELLKHGNNAQAYEHIVNNDSFHFESVTQKPQETLSYKA